MMGRQFQTGLDRVQRRAFLISRVSSSTNQRREGLLDSEDAVDGEEGPDQPSGVAGDDADELRSPGLLVICEGVE